MSVINCIQTIFKKKNNKIIIHVYINIVLKNKMTRFIWYRISSKDSDVIHVNIQFEMFITKYDSIIINASEIIISLIGKTKHIF